MTVFWPFFLWLIVACAAALISAAATRNGPMVRVALALALNWALNTWFCFYTGVYDPWYFFLLVDAATGALVLLHPAGRVQALIGCTYIGQVIIHLVYGAAQINGAEHLYWRALTNIGYVQLMLLGGWGVGYGGYRLWRRFAHTRVSELPRRQGVA